MSVIVALKFDERFGTARFLKVKHKASSNAFPIYRPSSRRLNLWAFPQGFPSSLRRVQVMLDSPLATVGLRLCSENECKDKKKS